MGLLHTRDIAYKTEPSHSWLPESMHMGLHNACNVLHSYPNDHIFIFIFFAVAALYFMDC